MKENFIQLKDYIRRLRSVAINQDAQIENIRRHLLPMSQFLEQGGHVSEQILDFLVDSIEPHFPGAGYILGGDLNPSFRRLANYLIVPFPSTEPSTVRNLN